MRWDYDAMPITHDVRFGSCHLLQRCERFLGFALLYDADGGIQDHNCHNHAGFDETAFIHAKNIQRG
ncbi:MAG: hypothetical protein BWY25_02716 [Chloroflexi bacterium ADurb.Bin222]|nr:MAG: hypothetical protein BWY25_02716 [Chloroflexi bacterium ADurb.Bin222]